MARSRDSRRRLTGGGVALLLLIAVIFLSTPAAPYIRGSFRSVLLWHTSAQRSGRYAGLSQAALISMLEKADKELATIRYQSILYGVLSDENAKLRAALNAGPPPNSVLARIISRPPQSAYDTLLLDAGTSLGIQKGDIAEYQGMAVGTVTSVGGSTSLVEMYSTGGDATDVLVGNSNSIAIAHGVGGGAFELSLPGGLGVKAGDTIRLSSALPFLLATVADISSTTDNASLTIRARSPFSVYDIDFVEVIRKPGLR